MFYVLVFVMQPPIAEEANKEKVKYASKFQEPEVGL
jgi:hypothetical protein